MIQIARAPVLLLELERLYESYGISSGANAPVRVREPPAGPKKIRNIAAEDDFPKILLISRNFEKS